MAIQQKFVALDTHFILALENGEEACQEVIDFFSSLRWFCIASETVREELQDLKLHSTAPQIQALAGNALKNLANCNILTPDLTDLNRDIAKIVGHKLTEAKLIPHGYLNDALVVSEAAMHNCVFLVTDRTSLAATNTPNAVKIALIAQDVPGCEILSLSLIHSIARELRTFQAQAKPGTA